MTKRSRRSRTFAVCIDNTGYPASLQAGKLYEVVPDQKAEEHGLLRVVDESGEDYGYAAERFFILAVPLALEKVLGGISLAKQLNPALRRRRASTERAAMKNQPGHAKHYADGIKPVVVKPNSGRARRIKV